MPTMAASSVKLQFLYRHIPEVLDMHEIKWQGNKDSNLGMLESKSSALTNLAIPLRKR
jgi:hypothetical protein